MGYDFNGARYIQHSRDFYCWHPGELRWWGVDLFGLLDLLRRNALHAYKEGRTVTRAEFQRLMHSAHVDPDFPRHGEPDG